MVEIMCPACGQMFVPTLEQKDKKLRGECPHCHTKFGFDKPQIFKTPDGVRAIGDIVWELPFEPT